MTELHPLSGRARVAALFVGAVFLLGAAAVLAAYITKYGLDVFAGYGLVIMVLVAVLLIAGAPSGKPRRWGAVRIAVSLLCFLSFVIFMILGFPAAGRHDGTAGGLLFVTGLLLTPIAPCVAMLGRPGAGRR
jgi:hypothetical protein